METIRLENVTFAYPLADRNALKDVSFSWPWPETRLSRGFS